MPPIAMLSPGPGNVVKFSTVSVSVICKMSAKPSPAVIAAVALKYPVPLFV